MGSLGRKLCRFQIALYFDHGILGLLDSEVDLTSVVSVTAQPRPEELIEEALDLGQGVTFDLVQLDALVQRLLESLGRPSARPLQGQHQIRPCGAIC